MYKVVLVHGPNLNLLGEREPEVYGSMTLKDVNDAVAKLADEIGVVLKNYQSNHEGALVDFLHENRGWADGILINPGALTHYSYSLRDAIAAVHMPAVEVHLSDIHQREPFRKISVIQEVCIRQLYGKGIESYLEGLKVLHHHLQTKR